MANKVKSEPMAVYAHNTDSTNDDAIIAQAQNIIRTRLTCSETPLTNPAETRQYFQVMLGTSEHEIFSCVMLDNRNRPIAYREMFRGTIDGASVYPREVVKQALSDNAAAIILAHNHPSGNPEPSSADINITKRLKDALALVDIRVLDHMIIGEDVTSFSERGLI